MRRSIPSNRAIHQTNLSDGLSNDQVLEQRQRYGLNQIVQDSAGGYLDLLKATASDPMAWFLALTATIYLAIGEYLEGSVLAAALIPIVGMDAWLHRRTQASTAGLRTRLATTVRARRDGDWREIDAQDLVPGDLVQVSENQLMPADGVVLSGEHLQVDESILTGEAMPVNKRPLSQVATIFNDQPIDGEHWAFAGTRLLTGKATVLVIFTAGQTYYGEIATSAQTGGHTLTPLQQSIGHLTKILIVVSIAICVALALVRLAQGHGFVDAILSAITLAVAALPEEFPVVFAFFLGVGVYRLAKQRALVRRAVAVENIGRITYICSDKTGTLTQGRLELAQTYPDAGIASDELLSVAATASRSSSGDPLDQAILRKARPLEGKEIATFPFTEDRRRETGVVQHADGSITCCSKGAPETIFKLSSLNDVQTLDWLERTLELAGTGHKVIAFCSKHLMQASWDGQEPLEDCKFLGLIAFEDPLRDGVIESVSQAQAAAIRIIMVTGDHPQTAHAIASRAGIGLGDDPVVVQGEELQAMIEQPDQASLHQIDVVARATPAQKLLLVQALQRSGEIVAVTGDGVNDVPALQGADVGIAMGERGTQSACEVAAILLMDDNFRTIVQAIAEGRQLFSNLKLSFTYLLMVHIPLVMTAALIPFAGLPLLYLPIHIVWLELIIHPTALLVFQQRASTKEMVPLGTQHSKAFFSKFQWFMILLVGGVMTAAVVFGYVRSLSSVNDVDHARTMAIVILIVASSAVTLGLSFKRSKKASLMAAGLTAATVLAAQLPVTAQFLHLTPLHWDDWLIAVLGGLLTGLLSAAFPLAGRWQCRRRSSMQVFAAAR